MGVGKVGGKKGAGGAKGPGGVGKAGGGGFAGKVGKSESLVGASGLVGGSNVMKADAVTAQALDIVRQLRSGQIKTREEATRKLVGDILREKVRLQSKTLSKKIAEHLEGDPRLTKALERIWNKADDKDE